MKQTFISLIILTVLQLSACSFFQQTSDGKVQSQNNSLIIPAENSMPENGTGNIAEINFKKEWKSKFEATAAELERNLRLWQDSKINDYDFVISKEAPGLTNSWRHSPVYIKIRKGQKISSELVPDDKHSVSPTIDGFEDFDTIDKLFAYLKEELKKERILQIKYDEKLGYPKDVLIIYSNEIHGYNNLKISNLQNAKAIEKGR